jgi:hypothetical protein
VRLDELAKSYDGRARFVGNYIREAHTADYGQVPANLDDGIIYDMPQTVDDRAEIAAACMLRYNFSFPMLLDNMENEADENYISWPDRLYIIGADGKVSYQAGLGPFYFDIEEFDKALSVLV